ncbi:MAG: laminin G domain-containing protein [Deltaproteobacteria bacterium]|nr:laminin G domain-containing protein [Deltaproteobacteria bacterium]
MKRFYLLPLFLLFVACGSLEKGSGSSVAFDLPPALQTETTADTKAFLLATNGEETKELELTIADGKVSGTINLKPGPWTLELHFYQKAPSGSYLLVAMVSFGEKEVGEEGMELPYDASQIVFDDSTGTSPSIASPSVSLPENCSKLFDCDGDGFSNFEEIKQGTDPEDPNSFPGKKSTSVSAPVTTVTPSPVTTPLPVSLTRVMDGLVGWWRFDEGTGFTAIDSSGNGNNGTLVPTENHRSPGRVAGGVSGEALQFDGVDDYVDGDSIAPLAGNQSITMEAWARPNSGFSGSNGRTLMSLGTEKGRHLTIRAFSDPGWSFSRCSGGPSRWTVGADDNGIDMWHCGALSSATITGSWYHVVASYDSSSQIVKLYVNGLLQTTTQLSGPLNFQTGFLIGQDQNLNQWFNGLIDEVAIYNRALSTAEVRNNCQVNDPTGSTCAAGIPIQKTPTNGVTLRMTRAFLSWDPVNAPKTIAYYQVCYLSTNYGLDLNTEGRCGDMQTTANPYLALSEDYLQSGQTYQWKVKTCYTDGTCSAYSPVWEFYPEYSPLLAWWKFDGDVLTDSKQGSYPGSAPTVSGFGLPNAVQSGGSCHGLAVQNLLDGAACFDDSDGSDDYINLDPQAASFSFAYDEAATIFVRFRYDNDSSGASLFNLAPGESGGPQTSIGLTGSSESDPDKIYFEVEDTLASRGYPAGSRANVLRYSTTKVKVGTFSDAVGIYDKGTVSLYHNGAFQGSGSYNFLFGREFANTAIHTSGRIDTLCSEAGAPGPCTTPSNILIDEIDFFNTALTAEQIVNMTCAVEALTGTDPLPEACR